MESPLLDLDLLQSTTKIYLSLTPHPAPAPLRLSRFGNNHYPATAAISVVFFPLVSNGVTKPALLLHVEDLDEAGIDEIAIVCQPGDVPAIQALFHNKLTPQNFSKLSADQKIFAKRLKVRRSQ